VLIEMIFGAAGQEFIACAFGFSSAKSCSVDVGLRLRSFLLYALLDPVQID
jgi:hypothetical protein